MRTEVGESTSFGPTSDVIEQAAQWAALLDSGEVSDQARRAYEKWCAAHPLHRRTLDRMRAFDAQVQSAGDFEHNALRRMVKRRPSFHRRLKGITLGIAVLAIGGWAGMQAGWVSDHFPDYRTGRGAARMIELADGSQLALDTDGAIDIRMNSDRRRVRLIRGQIFARVSKDERRPFVVETPHGTATALGTAFVVRRRDHDTIVTVVESRVRICPGKAALDDDRCRTLGAGERARVRTGEVTPLANVDRNAAALWASGWLEVDDQEVAEVLAELSRYRDTPIRFDAGELRGLRVTGSFPLRDIDRAIEGVARTKALNVRRTDDGGVVVERRR
jgi:transmembrane sensor